MDTNITDKLSDQSEDKECIEEDNSESCILCHYREESVQENDEEESVQENDEEENNKNDDFDIPFESFFLDIQVIEMFVKLNELITTHPFTLQMICFFMNILKWFRLPTAPYDQKS